MSYEKKLKQKCANLEKRLKKEPYPHTNLDSIVLRAGIGLLDEVLEGLGEVADKIREQIEKRQELTKAHHSDNPIPQLARKAYWRGYIEAKKEVLGLLVEPSKETKKNE